MRRDASSELQDFKGGSLFLQAASKGGLVYRKDRKNNVCITLLHCTRDQGSAAIAAKHNQ
ncbi:unnamed protein product [Prunus armeniaca]